MGYKALGFIVWRGARWYLGKKYSNAPRKIAIGTIAAGAVAAGLAALAQRQRSQ
ncbi:MAG: hypothetical protein QOG59_175 [Solirubrobacteraceae bacterium]|nr:hypothetical protein [Solirubrobacteraceae bacterium]